MKFELSKREKTMLFILAIVVIVAFSYVLFFNKAIDNWLLAKEEAKNVQEMANAIEQSGQELSKYEEEVEKLSEEARELDTDYYINYTSHMAEQFITSLLRENGLSSSYVSVSPVLLSEMASYDNSDRLSANIIEVRFSVNGTYNKMVEFLDLIDKKPGLQLMTFSINEAGNNNFIVPLYLRMIVGTTGEI